MRISSRSLPLNPARGALSSPMRLPAAASLPASLFAAVILATSAMPPAALAASTPTAVELLKIPEGLARIDQLLKNWDTITTVCNGVQDATEAKQVARTIGEERCTKSPLRVQQYIGASSTLDPLFKAEKLMIRAQPLVAEADQEAYSNAVDSYITQQQMSSTMAYTSSWSGIENPNGSKEQIEENLLEAKKEVLALRDTVSTVVELLHLPPAPALPPP
jgi:hypothetical protein|mmetsp:Transcript_3185/g.6874  ORF Transcript_3185/g.6874 Transcript_3185/m.6874 type:complete len:219 (-) Transcript_3185:641-1297(-)